jgi:hypothetical protein
MGGDGRECEGGEGSSSSNDATYSLNDQDDEGCDRREEKAREHQKAV